MKSVAALLFLLVVSADDIPHPPTAASFRYIRTLALTQPATSAPSGYACALLDAEVFAHSNPLLSDLRVFSAAEAAPEIPYVITLSTTSGSSDTASLLNLGSKSASSLAFDLKMPSRPYSSLDLHLDAHDYIASAHLTGLHSLTDRGPTYLGTFTLFDLTSQHLGRNFHLDFAESTFAYLHIEIAFTPAPGIHAAAFPAAIVTGADVPASRTTQMLFTPLLTTSAIAQQPRKSVATFKVPAHVPVERVSFELDPNDRTSFSRHVLISATPDKPAPDVPIYPERLSGDITHVHVDEAGREIREESLSVPAILGANAQSSATVTVTVENEDDRPLALKSVQLETRQRKLCFSLPPGSSSGNPLALFYGAPAVAAPVYDLARFFDPEQPSTPVVLGPEQGNPRYTPEALPLKPFTERHPAVLWLALLAVVAVLGSVAFRSAKRL